MVRHWHGALSAPMAVVLVGTLLGACGGSSTPPTDTPSVGTLPTQVAPVATAVASVAAPIETRVATVAAPAETRIATGVAPVQTAVATRVATVIDPILETAAARVGGVRPVQGACPSDHPVKARTDLIPPRRDYWTPDTPGYDAAQPAICFANEADAQTAQYRRAGS